MSITTSKKIVRMLMVRALNAKAKMREWLRTQNFMEYLDKTTQGDGFASRKFDLKCRDCLHQQSVSITAPKRKLAMQGDRLMEIQLRLSRLH